MDYNKYSLKASDSEEERITKLTNQAIFFYYILMSVTGCIMGAVLFWILRMDWIIWYSSLFVILHIAWLTLIIKSNYTIEIHFVPLYYCFMILYTFPIVLILWQIQVYSIILLYMLLPLLILFRYNTLKYTDYTGSGSVVSIIAVIIASSKYQLIQVEIGRDMISLINALIIIIAIAFIVMFFYSFYQFSKLMPDKKLLVAKSPVEEIPVADNAKLKEIYNQVISYFEEKKPYCQPNYRLVMLASELNTNTKYLSLAINTHYGENFESLLNKYRIEYVKQMLDESLAEKYTMEYIYTLAGYSSHTTFYENFRKIHKMSPSDYQKIRKS
jgi:AraC-like DNA-binding protein